MNKQRSINLIPINNIPEIKPKDNLAKIIAQTLQKNKIEIMGNDILVIAQKIVSKAENRIINLADVKPTKFAKSVAKETAKDPRLTEVILGETKKIIKMDLRTKDKGRLIVETNHGLILANAGVDTSNVSGGNSVTLLPVDSDKSATRIRNGLKKLLGKEIAVIITDTVGRPWREGLIDIAIGCAGIKGLKNQRGKKDTKGLKLNATVMAIADQIAAAAGLLMQKNNSTPAIIVRGIKVNKRGRGSRELNRKPKEDLFR